MKPKRAARTVAIIGTGLIGASLGLAVRHASKATRVIGYDRDLKSAREAYRRRAITSVAPSLDAAVEMADIVVLAVPLSVVVALLPRVLARAPRGSLVIDVAGLKVPVLAAAAPALRRGSRVHFAGGHPMAGRERSGPGAAQANLFAARPFALCIPKQTAHSKVWRKAAAFVRSIGARPVRMTAPEHDRIVAITSAMPQIIASATTLAAAAALKGKGNTRLIGPGFDSVTRLAASPPELWTSTILANKRNVIAALGVLEAGVRNFRRSIERYSIVDLRRLLRAAAQARRRLTPN